MIRGADRSTLGVGQPPWVLHLEGVCRSYGSGEARQLALRDVTLGVAPGELVALVGHSGSGKSTLLNIVSGLERPTAGRVSVCGAELGPMAPEQLARHRLTSVAHIFQDYNLIRTMTVLENVSLPLELRGGRRREARQRAEEALERVGVAGHGHKLPDQLSGGEQQRAAIARAVVDRRPLLVADEPTGALDSRSGALIVALLREVVAAGTACLVATHNPEVAAAAGHLIELRDGAIVRDTLVGPRS